MFLWHKLIIQDGKLYATGTMVDNSVRQKHPLDNVNTTEKTLKQFAFFCFLAVAWSYRDRFV